MTEYEVLNLMYLGFVQNGMFFVAMTLMTWLGFRMANNVYNSDADMSAKVFTSIFCLFVAFFFYTTNQIGGSILTSYTSQLVEMGADSGLRLKAIVDSPAAAGGSIQAAFTLFILVFQLAIVWKKK
jgi:hypothetical protein